MPTRVRSKATFMFPKGMGATWHTARTKPSPARVTTPAMTSRATPTATSTTPMRQ